MDLRKKSFSLDWSSFLFNGNAANGREDLFSLVCHADSGLGDDPGALVYH
ncbi:hypothetical protein [Robertkochia sediminum]|nr:hypothetical protein [Robertkochia sediminum]MBL7473395.1 hypothetical protein [Robertkochia sediminum]